MCRSSAPRFCFAFSLAVLLAPSVVRAADIGVLPLAAPQVDVSTRKMAQESLLTAVQAVFGSSIEPGELKKRLGPALKQALECSDSECWTKIGARSHVTYMVSARGFGKKGTMLLTLALVRASDGKVVGRAQQPLAVDDPAALSASCEGIVRKLQESAVAVVSDLGSAAAPATRVEVASASAGEGGDTVVNDQPGESGGPVTPLAGMRATMRVSAVAPEWKSGFGFVEDVELADDSASVHIDKAVTVGALPEVSGKASRCLFFFAMPSYADDVGTRADSRFRFGAEWSVALGDNALNSAPFVGSLTLPFPRVLLITKDQTTGARGWTQFLVPLGLSFDYRFLRLAHGFTVGAGPHGQIAGGFLAVNADTSTSTYVPAIFGPSVEATFGGHLSSSVRLGEWGIHFRGGAERWSNMVRRIGSTTSGTTTRIYGDATFLTLRLTASYGGLIFGGDLRSRMTDTSSQPPDPPGATYAAHSLSPNAVFGKELTFLIGGVF